MAMFVPLKKRDHVQTILDSFAQDNSFKDVVFMVGGEQLAYHSQILRNVFPFLKNFLPNPGSLGPWEAFMPRASSIVITLDGVSPSTVSSLMSSIYNQQKPTFLNKEETGKTKELLEMLGADSRKYNYSLNKDLEDSLQTNNIETETDGKANESDERNVKVDRIGQGELLLNETHNEAQGEVSDTVNEAVSGDWQRDGSCSSTVPQEDEVSDLDETVEDEEITFSIDASQPEKEAEEHLPNHDDARSFSSHEEQVQDTGVSVLSMVEQFMEEDAATNLPDSRDLSENLASENASNEHQMESNENEDMDEDIEVIAEVVDGVTEVVHEASEHGNDNERSVEAGSPVKIKEIKFAVQGAERIDLEVVIEEQLEDVRENKESNPSNDPGSLNIDSQNYGRIEETIVKEFHSREVNVQLGDPVNETEQDAVNEVVEEDCPLPGNKDEQRSEILDADEPVSSKPSIVCNPNQIDDQSDEDDFIEDDDDDELIEDEEDEEINVACAMENEVSNQDEMEHEDDSPVTDVDVSSRKRKLSDDELNDENQKKEKLAKSSPSSIPNTAAKSDDSDDEDFDLESLSAPIEDVRRVKRDLSESFELENDEDCTRKAVTSELFAEGDKASSVKVSFKGDDLEVMTDISSVEKKRLRVLEEEPDSNEEEDKKANAEEESSEVTSLQLSLSDEDGELNSEEDKIKETNYEGPSECVGDNAGAKDQNEKQDMEEAKEVEKTDEELDSNEKVINEDHLKKTNVEESSDDDIDLTSESDDDVSNKAEESPEKSSELGNDETEEKDSSELGNKVVQGDTETTKHEATSGEVGEAEARASPDKDEADHKEKKEDMADEDETCIEDDTEERAEDDEKGEKSGLDDYEKGDIVEATEKEADTEDTALDTNTTVAKDNVSQKIGDKDQIKTSSFGVKDDFVLKNVLSGEDGLENSLARVEGEDFCQTEAQGSAKEDNEEDADLLNIDEDDVDMLNEQTELDTSEDAIDKNNDLEEKKVSDLSEVSADASKVDESSESTLVTSESAESVESDKVGTEAAAITSSSCPKSQILKPELEPSTSAPEHLKPAPAPTTVSEEAVPGLSCPMCPTQPPLRRAQLLTHLTDKHYSKDLQQRFPWTEGASCQLCVDTSRVKVTISKTKATYAKHVGTVHEKVLDLVPTELKEAVLAVSKTRKSTMATIKEPEADGLEVVGVNKQELAGGNEVNTIKEECVDNDNVEEDAGSSKEVTETRLESTDVKVIEAKGLKSGQCPFCPNTKTQFQRSSLLNHLSSTHYNKQLLDAFPYQEGETCKLCLETGRQNPLVAKSKPRYINHMGSLHEKVMDLLPPNVKESLEVAKKITTRTTRKSVSSKDIQDTVSSAPSHTTVSGPSSSRGTSAGPTTTSTRAPAPGPPGPPLVRSLPKSLTVSAVPEDRLTNMGNVSISKVKEKKMSLPKLANVSISKIE